MLIEIWLDLDQFDVVTFPNASPGILRLRQPDVSLDDVATITIQGSWASTNTVSLSRSASPVSFPLLTNRPGLPRPRLTGCRRSRWMPMESSASGRI